MIATGTGGVSSISGQQADGELGQLSRRIIGNALGQGVAPGADLEHVGSEGRYFGGRGAGRPAHQGIEVGAPGDLQDPLTQRGGWTPAVAGTTHRAERCPSNRVAASLVAHLPAVAAHPVAVPFLIPSYRDAAGARAHHNAGAVGKGAGQGDFDVRGDHHVGGDVLVAERGAQLVPLRLPSRAGRTDHQHVAPKPAGVGQRGPHHFHNRAGRCQCSARTDCGSGAVGATHDLPVVRHADCGLGPSDIRPDQSFRHLEFQVKNLAADQRR